MNDTVFIFGFGYSAQFLAVELNNQGFDVIGTSRSADFRNEINQFKQSKQSNQSKQTNKTNKANKAIKLIDFDDVSAVQKAIQKSFAIVISTPPNSEDKDPSYQKYQGTIIENKQNIKWLGYLSSTGVYGNHHGNWVDETAKCSNHSLRAKRRIKAEKKWLGLYKNYQIPTHIFRLSGIYGKNRNALTRMKRGKNYSVYKPNHFFSRIHVLDIARFLTASIMHPTAGEVFNLSDDQPAPAYMVDAYASKLLDLPKPNLIDLDKANLSEMAKEFYQNNRRVSNHKIKQTYGLSLTFPSYVEGLEFELNQLKA